jgi:hypothetical protein
MSSHPPVDEQAWQRAVEHICAELGWKARIQSTDDHKLVMCPLPADDHFSGVLFVLSTVARRLAVYISYRTKASPEHWNAMSEAITRINFGLLGGCLELDPEGGEARYRDGLLLIRPEADVELLRALVATALRDALLYHPVIEAVTSGQPPAQGLANISQD